jgi:hypothetical protein
MQLVSQVGATTVADDGDKTHILIENQPRLAQCAAHAIPVRSYDDCHYTITC